VPDPVSALGERAEVGAVIKGIDVPVVALLIERRSGIDNAVATSRRNFVLADLRASVSVGRIPVVALLNADLYEAVAAGGEGAIIQAPVDLRRIPIVALLDAAEIGPIIGDMVSTSRQGAEIGAFIGVNAVSVVALLVVFLDVVTAFRVREPTIGLAPRRRRLALFSQGRLDHAVAAELIVTLAVAAVAALIVSLIAFFDRIVASETAVIRVPDPVPALGERAEVGAVVKGIDVPVVALLARIQNAVAAVRSRGL